MRAWSRGREDRRFELLAADVVEVDVDPVGCGGAQRLRRTVVVVEGRVGAELVAHVRGFFGRARRTDHAQARALRELHDHRADRAGGGGNEQRLAFFDARDLMRARPTP